jgi:hypothetical protein
MVILMRNEELEMAAPKGPASQRPKGLASHRPKGLASPRPKGLASRRPKGLASHRKTFGLCWLKTWNRESIFL